MILPCVLYHSNVCISQSLNIGKVHCPASPGIPYPCHDSGDGTQRSDSDMMTIEIRQRTEYDEDSRYRELDDHKEEDCNIVHAIVT
ncbi:hypothetical protein KCU99_g259, partial [Aureobasidium melanogenum]